MPSFVCTIRSSSKQNTLEKQVNRRAEGKAKVPTVVIQIVISKGEEGHHKAWYQQEWVNRVLAQDIEGKQYLRNDAYGRIEQFCQATERS